MPDPLRPRIADLPPVIPAVKLDLPPHAGRNSEHRILRDPGPTHRVEVIDASDIPHPAAGPGDAPYRLFRAVPLGAVPEGGWPVLYMLDGNAAFDFLSAALLATVPGLVVIGIGHATDQQFDRIGRARDMGFPGQGTGSRGGTPPGGGAPAFIALLLNALRQRAEAGLPIDGNRRSIWGHSLAGLFVLRLMLGQPDGFARYASISPSLWLGGDELWRMLDQAPPQGPLRLYLASGNREKRTGSDGPEPTDAPAAFHALLARLRRCEGIGMSHQIYDGARHIASLPTSLGPVLRFAAV